MELTMVAGMAVLAVALGVATAVVLHRRRSALDKASVYLEASWSKLAGALASEPGGAKTDGQGGSGADPSVRRNNLGLQGNLAQTGLHDLLQFLALGRKSGILELTSGRRNGRILFREGKVYKSSYRGKEGAEAVFSMMDLQQGDFEFYEQVLEDAAAQQPLEVVDIIMFWMDRKAKQKASQ